MGAILGGEMMSKPITNYEVEEWLGSDAGLKDVMLDNAVEILTLIANGKYTANELRKAVIELQEGLNNE